MATIVLQTNDGKKSGKTEKSDGVTTATVASSPGRLHYATIDGIPRTLERVGKDASGNEIYRDQKRY